MLNKIKKHAMALAALTIAIGSLTLMSFKAELKSSANQIWFEVNESNNPTTLLPNGPDPNCERIEEPNCAKLYNEEDTEETSSGTRVKLGHESNYIDFVSLTQN